MASTEPPAAKRAKSATTTSAAPKAGGWDLLLTHCRIATMSPTVAAPYGAVGSAAATGAIGISNGRLAFVGAAEGLPAGAAASAKAGRDLGGRWVTPGLIDCHTHMVYGP